MARRLEGRGPMNEDTSCIRCGKPGETKWTINGNGGFQIMWLCAEHEKPLTELVELAAAKTRPGAKTKIADVPPSPAPRRKTVKPLNWTPPS